MLGRLTRILALLLLPAVLCASEANLSLSGLQMVPLSNTEAIVISYTAQSTTSISVLTFYAQTQGSPWANLRASVYSDTNNSPNCAQAVATFKSQALRLVTLLGT